MRLTDMTLEEAIAWLDRFNVSRAVAEFVYQQGLIPSPDRFPDSISDEEIEALYVNVVGMSTLDFGQLLAVSRYDMPEGDVLTIVEEDEFVVDLSDPLPRVDAAPHEDEPDLVDLLIEAKQKQFGNALNGWWKAIAPAINQVSSLEALQSELERNPGQVYRAMKPDRYATALYELMFLAELGGQAEVLDEDRRQDAESPRYPWLRLKFTEAIDWFRQKLTLTDKQMKSMGETYRDLAFSIAGINKAEVVEDVRFLVDQAIAEGNSAETFQKQWKRLIGRKHGWNPSERRMNLILNMNARSAHANGRATQMYDPDVLSRRPYIIWRHRDSPDPRLNHKALHNKAILATAPFWDKVSFPANWNCRCMGFSVSRGYIDRNGIEILKNPPDPETIAGEEFRHPFRPLTNEQRQEMLKSMREKLPPDLRKLSES